MMSVYVDENVRPTENAKAASRMADENAGAARSARGKGLGVRSGGGRKAFSSLSANTLHDRADAGARKSDAKRVGAKPGSGKGAARTDAAVASEPSANPRAEAPCTQDEVAGPCREATTAVGNEQKVSLPPSPTDAILHRDIRKEAIIRNAETVKPEKLDKLFDN